MVERLGRKSLDKLLTGEFNLGPVVIKCYNNSCHLCHELKPFFQQLSKRTPAIKFFAFNMEDGAGLEKKYGFEGVPTILFVDSGKVEVMPEPENPHPKHWYHLADLEKFINHE